MPDFKFGRPLYLRHCGLEPRDKIAGDGCSFHRFRPNTRERFSGARLNHDDVANLLGEPALAFDGVSSLILPC